MGVVKKRDAVGNLAGYWHEEENRWATQEEYEATYMKGKRGGKGPEGGDEDDDTGVEEDYEALTKDQLGERLTEAGIDFSPHLKKSELIDLVRSIPTEE